MDYKPELVPLADLRPHPRNYRHHPPDQLRHLCASIKQHGLYRNIVIAKDGTILAGHGVSEACKALGIDRVPVIRLSVDREDPKALKVLAGDNEVTHLGEVDDRALSEMLREIKEMDASSLLGTGYDDMMLANLVMVTRPEHEIRDAKEAAQWVGMPVFEASPMPLKIIVSFETEAHREGFLSKLGVNVAKRQARVWSMRYPDVEAKDLKSLKFEAR